jgi:hypothetical protein
VPHLYFIFKKKKKKKKELSLPFHNSTAQTNASRSSTNLQEAFLEFQGSTILTLSSIILCILSLLDADIHLDRHLTATFAKKKKKKKKK